MSFIQVCKLFRNLSSNCLFVNVTYKLLLKTNFQLRSFKGAHFQIKSWNLLRCTQDINCKGSKNTNEETKCVLNDENMPCHWQYNSVKCWNELQRPQTFLIVVSPPFHTIVHAAFVFLSQWKWDGHHEMRNYEFIWHDVNMYFLVMIDARLVKTL